MRILLFTGKGGVGKTSVAAATALRAADAGLRTLVVSTDAAHSLGDALGVEIGDAPSTVAPNLQAEQIDAQARLEQHWRGVQEYLVALLSWGGVGDVEAEELSVLPGLEEVLSLIALRGHVDAGAHDLLVVDCAPTAETLRLLSLPDVLGWYMDRVFPVERTLVRALRPVLGRVSSVPLPADRVMGAVEDLYADLEAVRAILGDTARTSARLVVNAEALVVAEARRTYTALSLFGYGVDAVVVNRLLPDAVTDPWFDRWKAVQAEHVETIRAGFADTEVLSAPLFDDELVGIDALRRLGEQVYGARDPSALLSAPTPLRFAREPDGWLLELALPFVERADVDAFAKGDELVLRVAGRTRSLLLPSALRRCEVVAATLADGRLRVRFASPGHRSTTGVGPAVGRAEAG